MPLGLDQLRQLYARCDPDEPLEPGDARYVDIDHLDAGGGRPRRYAWVQRIARKFELAAEPSFLLLTGLPGSGKSTELRRILTKLREPAGAALFPALIEADAVLDLRAPLDIPELILAMLIETERRIMIDLDEVAPDDVDAKLAKDSIFNDVRPAVSQTDAISRERLLEVSDLATLPPLVADLTGELFECFGFHHWPLETYAHYLQRLEARR